MKRILLSLSLIVLSIVILVNAKQHTVLPKDTVRSKTVMQDFTEPVSSEATKRLAPTDSKLKKKLDPPVEVPIAKIIENDYHIFQTFNNCGPAALSMALSYFNIHKSQKELGQDLRPYQNPQGDNDDKSVTLSELEFKAREFDLITFHRPNGNIALLERFLAEGIPIITRTQLEAGEDIGHYRVVKGYDKIKKEIIQDDSLQGHNLRYSYVQFENLWKMFNYEYLVIVPKDKKHIVESILGEEVDIKVAWTNAAKTAEKALNLNSEDIYSRFNLSIALYYMGDFTGAIREFESVENKLPFRTLWYQIEPLLAYYKIGDYSKIMSVSDKIFSNQNRAYSELYILRGDVFKDQGKIALAKAEYEKAVYYNRNLKTAAAALEALQLVDGLD